MGPISCGVGVCGGVGVGAGCFGVGAGPRCWPGGLLLCGVVAVVVLWCVYSCGYACVFSCHA